MFSLEGLKYLGGKREDIQTKELFVCPFRGRDDFDILKYVTVHRDHINSSFRGILILSRSWDRIQAGMIN